MRMFHLLGLLAACGGTGSDTADTDTDTDTDTDIADPVTLTDEGLACLWAEDPGPVAPSGETTFVADAPLYVVVQLGELGGCDEILEESCTVDQVDDALSVSASATYQPFDGTCSAEAVALLVTCTTGDLAAGTYTVSYGGDTVDVEIPSSAPVPVPCVGT